MKLLLFSEQIMKWYWNFSVIIKQDNEYRPGNH